jgi:pimeloyl-ACP methyl ester carboxylesterase
MSRQRINGVDLYFERHGDGEPIVLVHGSWVDHHSWSLVVDELARTNHLVSYDRRGPARRERGAGPVPRRVDEDDLAALIEALGLAPAHLVGNSYGGAISLGLAARRAELVRSVVAHEPPCIGLDSPGSPLADLLPAIVAAVGTVADLVRRGDAEGAAAHFVDEVVLGPGAWQHLPPQDRRTMIANAPTILDLQADPLAGVPRGSPTSRHRYC